MKILYYPHIHYKAQFFLRYLWPASQLVKMGHEVKVKDPRLVSLWSEEMMADDFVWCDTVVGFYPKTRSGTTLVEVCQDLGKKLIVDVDDFAFAIHPSNQAYSFGGTEDVDGMWRSGIEWRKDIAFDNHRRWIEVMKYCDAMTVTTQALAGMYAPYVGDHKLWVLPNSLNLNFYRPWKRRAPDDVIRIGWQGGASHLMDMEIIKEPLKKLQKEFNNIQLVFFGQVWPSLQEAHPDAEFHPWVDSDTFQLKLGSLDLDIGLCPIADDMFGRGKSNLKMLEYGAYNVPSVCSKIADGPYNAPHGTDLDFVDRVLCDNDSDDWYSKTKELIVDETKRREIGVNARRTVEEIYNIELTGKLWAECYEETSKGNVDFTI